MAGTQEGADREVDAYLRRKYPSIIKDVVLCSREDLALKNHLSGLKRTLLQVCDSWTDEALAVSLALALMGQRVWSQVHPDPGIISQQSWPSRASLRPQVYPALRVCSERPWP